MDKRLVAIVLPMYNEEESIPSLRAMFDGNLALPEGCDYRIIAVNDGSDDRTLELVTRWARDNWRVSAVSHVQNMGLGQAILTGIGEAVRMRSDVVVTMDADASHPGEVIRRLVDEVLNEADIAIASRFVAGSRQVGVPLYRRALSAGAKLALRAAFPLEGVSDYTIGFRAYSARVSAKIICEDWRFAKSRSFAFTAEMLLGAAAHARRIAEVPVCLRYDLKKSRSKLRLAATLLDYAKLFMRPGHIRAINPEGGRSVLRCLLLEFRKVLREETGAGVIDYLVATAVIATVAYVCRNILVNSLKAAHNSMVNSVTNITGN
ncbi:MAG: glycosyltransferase family 2 protein [Peptococcaceae bacterium]|nr:glycosyltransferase family 2 protein [Peptococcaceae bacterium]